MASGCIVDVLTKSENELPDIVMFDVPALSIPSSPRLKNAFPASVTPLSLPVAIATVPNCSNVELVTETPVLFWIERPPESFMAIGFEPSNSMFEKLTLVELVTFA